MAHGPGGLSWPLAVPDDLASNKWFKTLSQREREERDYIFFGGGCECKMVFRFFFQIQIQINQFQFTIVNSIIE